MWAQFHFKSEGELKLRSRSTSARRRRIMLSTKVAHVTGAAQGIGLAITRLLLKNGAKVCMVDKAEKVGRKACESLQSEFAKNSVIFQRTDVTNKRELEAAFAKTKKEFGGIDIVCNNAAIACPPHADEWKAMLELNLASVVAGTFLGIEYMSTQKGGRGGTIINMASIAGLVPTLDNPLLCASKHGVVGFSRSMIGHADSESDFVRVNCVCPSFVNTTMVTDNMDILNADSKTFIKNHGLIDPETVAEGVLELITDTSKSGSVMTITAIEGRKYADLLGMETFYPRSAPGTI